ncbi:Retrovirus-related Pol polyprotein from transposon TNT 1-94 [Eumeta japonica]|uniref:Retrovirus-related Pol polyprotein from transposon TNT 1-94 n=1 Tax=Eumeta variegata TaxID=151549 RepID=A0A4C1T4D8_EUMVA|nr:Retrovirus-related Pol polyprotein from transposon TNT 1-94 [Eumeta japonica]
MRIFGSPVIVHVNKEKRSKWDKKSTECILVGYPGNVKGYRVYDPVKIIITTSRDEIVMEKESIMMEVASEGKDQESVNDGMPQESPNLQDSVGGGTDSTLTEVSEESEDDFLSDYIPSEYEKSIETIDDNCHRVRSTSERRAPNRYSFDGICHSENDMVCGADLTLKQVLKGPEENQWLQAVKDELKCFEDNGIWDVVNITSSGTIVQCKWVLKKKIDPDNKVRHRAKLVAKRPSVLLRICTSKILEHYESGAGKQNIYEVTGAGGAGGVV